MGWFVGGMRKVTTSGYGVSFWDDKNVINLGGHDGFTASIKLHVKSLTYVAHQKDVLKNKI